VYTVDTTVMHFVGFNFENKWLRQPEFRRYLASCDTAAAAAPLVGRVTPAILPVPPCSPLYAAAVAKISPPPTMRPQTAAGDFKLVVCGQTPEAAEAAEQLAQVWRDGGLSVTVQVLPYKRYTKALRDGDFDLYYGRVRLSPDFSLAPFCARDGALNFGGYAGRDGVYGKDYAPTPGNLAAFYEECPVMPLWFERECLAVKGDLFYGSDSQCFAAGLTGLR